MKLTVNSLFAVLLAILVVVTISLAAQVDFCREDQNHNYWTILDHKFNNMTVLNRDIFNSVVNSDKYNYNDRCGGEFGSCTGSNIIFTDPGTSEQALALRTRLTEKGQATTPYMTSGVNTRDKFVIKRSAEAITRICVELSVPTTIKNLQPTIRLVSNNSFNLNSTAVQTHLSTAAIGGVEQPDEEQGQKQQQQQQQHSHPTLTQPMGNNDSLNDLSKHKRPHYDPAANRNGSESLACLPDYGDLTAFSLNEKRWSSTFTWQANLNQTGICQSLPQQNKRATFAPETDLDLTTTKFQLNVEYGPRYIAYYDSEGKQIFNMTRGGPEANEALGINTTQPYYLDITTLVMAQSIPELDTAGTEHLFKIHSIKITHNDPETDIQETLFDIKWGLIALAVLVAVGLIAFISIFVCGTVLNKMTRQEELDFEEDLLLNN